MAITRNKPDMEHKPSAGSYYKLYLFRCTHEVIHPAEEQNIYLAKRNPSEIFLLITTTATYKAHRKSHIILRSFSGKSFPDAKGQQLLTALRQPIQSSSYCGHQRRKKSTAYLWCRETECAFLHASWWF